MTWESWPVRCTWTVKYGRKQYVRTLQTAAVEKSFLLLLGTYCDFYNIMRLIMMNKKIK